jgi:GNAT superfamily N-acetyltransferase
MSEITQRDINTFCKNVRNKYKNIVQNLNIIVQEENILIKKKHLYLVLIRIRKTKRNKGYGSEVMKEIIQYAEENNIPIYLTATSMMGSNINKLHSFYLKLGFILINNVEDTFAYYPKNLL